MGKIKDVTSEDYKLVTLVSLCTVIWVVITPIAIYRVVQGDVRTAFIDFSISATAIFCSILVIKTKCTTIGAYLLIAAGSFSMFALVLEQQTYNLMWLQALLVGAFGLLNSRQAFIYSVIILSIVVYFKELWTQPEVLLTFGLSTLCCAVVCWIILRQNEKQKDLLEHSAKIDPLTKLLNRRTYAASLQSCLDLKQRYGYEFGALVLDLDHFKSINDEFGHEAGDGVLEKFGALLLNFFRNEDRVFRVGGEEFVVLLQGISPDSLSAIANRLCKTTETKLTRSPTDSTPLTVSIGGAILRKNEDYESWLKRADNALYTAKSTTRNTAKVEEP